MAAHWLGVARLCAALCVSAAPVVEFKLPAPLPPEEIPSTATTLEPVAAVATPDPVVEVPAEASVGRPVTSWLEAQIELARRGFSSGAIDGVGGAQSAAALRAFQESENLAPSGALDVPTREKLLMRAEPLTTFTLSAADCAR
ncbi:MAG: peptidoglycan-binding domain-containing protein, partial [Opitutaceae bacterium]